MTIKAYIYSRFSSARQEHGDSMRRQHKACFEFAETLGVPIDPVMHDPGLSAFTGLNRLRGTLASFIARVEAGEIARGSYLLVDSLDRLSREDETTALHMMTGLSLAGVRIVSVSEKHVLPDKPDMTDWIRLIVHASRAHKESLQKSENVAKAHGESKQRARDEGRPWHRSCPAWLKAHQVGEKRNKVITFELIEERVALVQRIFDMREAGMGSHIIALRLNDEKVAPLNGGGRKVRPNGFNGNGIATLLRNRAVLGEYQPKFKIKHPLGYSYGANDGDPVPGYYGEPIIEPAQFHRVQALVEAARKRPGKKGAHTELRNLFQGVCICSSCGGTVGGIKNRRGGNLYVRCLNAMRRVPDAMSAGLDADGKPTRAPCSNRQHYHYTKLEGAILAHVTHFELTKPPIRDTKRDALTMAMAERQEIEAKVQRLTDEIEKPESASDEDLRVRRRQRREERAVKDLEIARLQREIVQEAVATPVAQHMETVRGLRGQLSALDGSALYELRVRLSSALKGVVDYLSFDDDGVVYAMVLGGYKAYRFINGEYVDEAQLMPWNTVREQHTSGDADRERLFERIASEAQQSPAEGTWVAALRNATLREHAHDVPIPGLQHRSE